MTRGLRSSCWRPGNTVSTGLVPPAALGLVRPEMRATGPARVPGAPEPAGARPGFPACSAAFPRVGLRPCEEGRRGSRGLPSALSFPTPLLTCLHPLPPPRCVPFMVFCTAGVLEPAVPSLQKRRSSGRRWRCSGPRSALGPGGVVRRGAADRPAGQHLPRVLNAISQRELCGLEPQCLLRLLLDAFGLLESRLIPTCVV